MAPTLPCGQFVNAATIWGRTDAGTFFGTGGLPASAWGCCGVVRVSSVSPTTIPAAARATTATVRYRELRGDTCFRKGSGNAQDGYYRF